MRTIKMLHLNSIWVTHGNVTCTYHMRMSIVKNKKENSSEHSLPLQKELWFPEPSHFTEITNFLSAATAKSLQSCPTLWDPIDGSPPGSVIPGILQARTLEWVTISFSNAWKWKVKVKPLGRVRPSATPWTAAFQAPPSIGFSRQEYWIGVPVP